MGHQTTKSPQQETPAPTSEGFPQFHVGTPTIIGDVPPSFAGRFVAAPPGQMPEWAKLPSPRERCPITGASRSWLLDQEKAGRIKIVRIRQPGRMRGACFVYLPSLLTLLRGELEKQGAAGTASVEGGRQ
jgi:hypothetical protein